MAVLASFPRRVLVGAVAFGCCAGVSTAGAVATAASAPAPGHWTVVSAGLGQPEAGTPVVWEDSSHHAWVLWLRKLTSSTATYEAVQLAANGAIAKPPADIFSGADWGSLSNTPSLVGAGTQPGVVFSGIRGSSGPYSSGCVYAAFGGTTPWTLQPGALSANCVNPIGTSAESKTGVLATAFPGGWATGHDVLWHVGVSATEPATEPDGQISTGTGVAAKAGVVNDVTGSGDFSVVYAQVFSTPASGDGFYVKDVTAGSATLKAPGSGSTSVNDLGVFANLAVANTNSHPGVYVAYCSNTPACKVQLWKVGSAKTLTVPGSTGAYDIAVAAGPAGRLWVAWYNESTNKLSVVRTNPSDTKFGAVKTLATGCFEHGLIGLGSGAGGRLEVALQCVNNASAMVQDQVTEVVVPLQVGLSATSVTNTAKRTLTVSVTDVGSPVRGAKVVVAGHKGTTNAKGKATITLPKGVKAGSYKVTVSAADYLTSTAAFSVKS